MGITVNGLRFLLLAKEAGADFSRTAVIGRQKLELSLKELGAVVRGEFGLRAESSTLQKVFAEGYAEELLKLLGARTAESFDYSDYEGATRVHDFNLPLPDEWAGQFTAVIDGGTLEHVFNFPTAIANCLRLLAVGGHYLGISPANNYLGHGFYQFSPELYYRILSPENGFRVLGVFCHEGRESKAWFSIPDPDQVRRRLGVVNAAPLLLLVLAKKIEESPLFSRPPLQSDYLPLWNVPAGAEAASSPGRLDGLKKRFSLRMRKIVPFVFPRRRFPPEFEPFSPCGSDIPACPDSPGRSSGLSGGAIRDGRDRGPDLHVDTDVIGAGRNAPPTKSATDR
jgi:hypothetical protein